MTTDAAGHSGAEDGAAAIEWAKVTLRMHQIVSAADFNAARTLLAMSAELTRLREDARLMASVQVDSSDPRDIYDAAQPFFKRACSLSDEDFDNCLRNIFNLPSPAKAAQGESGLQAPYEQTR